MSKFALQSSGRATQGGFTLIELVVVIVILGILAAFAVPRFARLDTQARVASVRALEGGLRSGAMLARSAWLAAGNNAAANIAIDGSNVAMVNGYPSRDGIRDAMSEGSIVNANQNTAGRFREVFVDATTVRFELNGATTPASCFVSYRQAANANAAPAIAVGTTCN